MSETHTVIFEKLAKRALRDDVVEGNFTSLLASTNNRGLAAKGWSMDTDASQDSWHGETTPDDERYRYLYRATIVIENNSPKAPGKYEFPAILRTLATKTQQPAYGSWTLATVDGEAYLPIADDEELSASVNDALIGYAEVVIPDEFEANFDHLYGLEPHIARVKAALLAGTSSNWRNRFHAALVGPPGCGKSDICGTLKSILGEDAVMEFDATATTAAGAIKELTERDVLPRVLIVEEIEKADEKALTFLLALMDLRGEIRKTTARATIQRDTKLFVIATVNNVALFEHIAAGALASRFSNKIGFRRPSRDTLAMILQREVAKVEGDVRWIGPTLDYAEERGITDPRQIIALCLCGADMWLTGEYAKMMEATEAVYE